MGKQWTITDDHEYSFSADLRDSDVDGVWRDAYVRWDGCVQFARYFNEAKDWEGRSPDDIDNVHLCGVADTIADLVDLLQLAQKKFGAEWDKEAADLDKLLQERGWTRQPK